MAQGRILATLLLAAAVYGLVVLMPWHGDPGVRRGAALVAATLILWIAEAAPLGIVALLIPVVATLSGILPWARITAVWGDPIVFLFMSSFLLVRALEKFGVFEPLLAGGALRGLAARPALLTLAVLSLSGLLSTVQNNTAVTALLLPLVLRIARQTRYPAVVLLALSYGSTFGGMATPVGTAPNMIGFEAIKRVTPEASFISWLWVGVPVWVGTTLIGWGVLALTRRWATAQAAPDVIAAGWPPIAVGAGARTALPTAETALPSTTPLEAIDRSVEAARRRGRRAALGAFLVTATIWLSAGLVLSVTQPSDALNLFVRTYLPESLVPVVTACALFAIRIDAAGQRVLDRSDLQAIDWDTLFLIAGGLALGRVLDESGCAAELARAVGAAHWSPAALLLVLALTTVFLSELTSNTATAALLVPVADALGAQAGVAPERAILLVALAASLGFALPISTPPNALVYGAGLIRLRYMAAIGLLIDVLAAVWLVACVLWLTG